MVWVCIYELRVSYYLWAKQRNLKRCCLCTHDVQSNPTDIAFMLIYNYDSRDKANICKSLDAAL